MKTGILLGLMLGAAFAQADVVQDQLQFHKILLDEVRADHPSAKPEDIAHVHYLGNAAVEQALSATTLDQALMSLHGSGLMDLVARTSQVDLNSISVPAVHAKRPLTMVIVPGVFGEFIANRAFEEVLAAPSALRDQFHRQVVADPQAVDEVVELVHWQKPPGASGRVEDLGQRTSLGGWPQPLDSVIHMGEVQVAGQPVRVILFYTKFATLESLGSAPDIAALFTRRLENYLRLTGDQDLAFIGYSRGTIVGLEMLAQAKAQNKAWLKNVKAMISLSGVVWGSSLADDVTENSASAMHKIIADLTKTTDSLSYLTPHTEWFLDPKFWSNNSFWLGLGERAAVDYVSSLTLNWHRLIQQFPILLNVNPVSPLGVAKRMWNELGLDQFVPGYNLNVDRFRYFVAQLLGSVNELSTAARLSWWSTHEVPKDLTYYAITATMANPDNPPEKPLFDSPLSYGNGNYDDYSLLLNRLDYAGLKPGVALNDSQVSVGQAAFLPAVIAQLNPANQGLRTKFLGVAGTHHWGMALRIVNEMRAMGKENGFPRAAMLRALATQVLIDQAAKD